MAGDGGGQLLGFRRGEKGIAKKQTALLFEDPGSGGNTEAPSGALEEDESCCTQYGCL